MIDAATVPTLQRTLPASRVGAVAGQQALEAFLNAAAVPAATQQRALLLLEEALMNVAMHAFDEPQGRLIELGVRLPPGEIEITVSDDGRPFDPLPAPLPARAATLAETEPGGLGLQLLRRFASSLAYVREGGRNRLTVRLMRGP
jgi:anti-sigma regulatory factor (Ser/Thr protein kinase)